MFYRSAFGKLNLAALVSALSLLFFPEWMLAQQLSSHGSVPITAVVRGFVSVSIRTAPVCLELDPSDPTRNSALVPVAVRWNLNPAESNGFEVIGYFANPLRALTNYENGFDLPSDYVLGRINSGPFQRFNQKTPIAPAGGSLSLLREHVLPGRARGQRDTLIELLVDDSVPGLPHGRYEGVLHIEVRHY